MSAHNLSAQPARALQFSAIVGGLMSLAVFVVAALLGHVVLGLAVGLGLLLGSGNGWLANRFVDTEVPYLVTSLFRLVMFTVVALLGALFLGLSRAWMPVVGFAVAQLVLAASAAVEVARQRR